MFISHIVSGMAQALFILQLCHLEHVFSNITGRGGERERSHLPPNCLSLEVIHFMNITSHLSLVLRQRGLGTVDVPWILVTTWVLPQEKLKGTTAQSLGLYAVIVWVRGSKSWKTYLDKLRKNMNSGLTNLRFIRDTLKFLSRNSCQMLFKENSGNCRK